jgi:hypothetical protein
MSSEALQRCSSRKRSLLSSAGPGSAAGYASGSRPVDSYTAAAETIGAAEKGPLLPSARMDAEKGGRTTRIGSAAELTARTVPPPPLCRGLGRPPLGATMRAPGGWMARP